MRVRRIIHGVAVVVAVALVGAPLAACGSGDEAQPTGSASTPTIRPTAPSGALATVLRRAAEEEQHAVATYEEVLATLGQVQPFLAIAKSEKRHLGALRTVAATHDVDLSGTTAAATPSPPTLAAACAMGVAAEKADVALYDELLPQVQAYPDVVRVFTNLRAASKDSHLPAFTRCQPGKS